MSPDDLHDAPLDRRHFLRWLGAGGLAAFLAACQGVLPAATPQATATPPASPGPSPALTPSATLSPAPSATATGTPTATASRTPTATASRTATPADSPVPTSTPRPTRTPTRTPAPDLRPHVGIARARDYNLATLRGALLPLLDGSGLRERVRPGARVGIKVNLTGTPQWDAPGKPPANELFVTHPAVVQVLGEWLRDAGAARLVVMDGLGDQTNFARWGYTAMAAALGAELRDLCLPDPYPDFVSFPVAPHAFLYDHFELNGVLGELDLLVSVAKMKCHWTAGVTLSLKNLFGLAPISRYRRSPEENNRSWFHEAGDFDTRVPRVVLDLAQARRIDFGLIDGVFTAEGGAGPWDPGLAQVRPGLLVAGRNPVATDAVATALMGFSPEAPARSQPFMHGDNHLALADAAGLGPHRLAGIALSGVPLVEAVYPFRPAG